MSASRAAAVVAMVVLATRSTGSAAAAPIEGPFGQGAAAVWLLRPRSTIRCVVVFGHGWKVAPPSPTYPWVGQFLPWLDHLVGDGCAVIFPRYQLGTGEATGPELVDAFRRGVSTGFAHLGRPPVPVVVAGYSYGAALVLTYAANAATWRLPTPAAVDAVFPAAPIAGQPLPSLAPPVRVLIQVGDADSEAGSAGAGAFWKWLSGHPATRKRYEVVRSRPGFVATHAAPKEASAEARAAFWAPLDRLIRAARGGGRKS